MFETQAEAEAILDATVAELADGRAGEGVTLETWGRRVLDQRERDGLRGIKTERNRWATYVAKDAIAKIPLRSLCRADVLLWLDGVRHRKATAPASGKRGARKATARKLGRQTVMNALNLLRAVLYDAAARNVTKSNPAREVALPRDGGRTHEPWTYLNPDEQHALVGACGEDWPLVGFAIGTGLRQGEQWALQLADVHVAGSRPHVVVRFGSPGQPTKSGKIRVVPLFGIGLDAAIAQLALLAAAKRGTKLRENSNKVLFPSVRGQIRKAGAPSILETACEAALIGRHVRWHDLRHTCASSLIAGWWGRSWSLEEVRAMLGHSTIKVTERYAHLAGTLLDRAAEATRQASQGYGFPPGLPAGGPKSLSHLRDLNSRPTVYETQPNSNDSAEVESLEPHEQG